MKRLKVWIFGILAVLCFVSCDNAADTSGNDGNYSITVTNNNKIIDNPGISFTVKDGCVDEFPDCQIKAGNTVSFLVYPNVQNVYSVIVVVKDGKKIIKQVKVDGVTEPAYVSFEMPAHNVTIDIEIAPYYRPLTEINENDPNYMFVTFGEWPQTKLTDKAVSVDENQTRTAGNNTYYKGSDNAWYAKCQNEYYKVEPIKWNNFIPSYPVNAAAGKGKRLLISTDILLYLCYYGQGKASCRTGIGPNPNKYEDSCVRAFLNGLSYNNEQTTDDRYLNKGLLFGAFSETERNLIATTSVLNGATSTEEKIFLLSKQELTNDYGWYFKNEGIKTSTDYAYNLIAPYGGYPKAGYWWLRSPKEGDAFDAYAVNSSGDSIDSYDVHEFPLGVVPALCLE